MGLAVGWTDGAQEGFAVGAGVGDFVGTRDDGFKDGANVGKALGDGEGSWLGERLGDAVGLLELGV